MKIDAPTTRIKFAIPRIANVCNTSVPAISRVAIGAVTSAPAPKPATATPVMKPRRSGNHLTSVAIGTI